MKTASTSPSRHTQTPEHQASVFVEHGWLRWLIGLLLVGHLIAVVVPPFATLANSFPPRASTPGPPVPLPPEQEAAALANRPLPVILRVADVIEPYLNLLYLNHGYSFFAPEPAASYVLEYEVERPNRTIVRGRLPDPDRHWPRLLYHRYFMLAAQNREIMDQAAARGKVPTDSSETFAHAIAEHLTEIHGGRRTALRLLVHRLLWPSEVQQGTSSDAPETYFVVGAITYPPESPPEEIEQRTGAGELSVEEVQP